MGVRHQATTGSLWLPWRRFFNDVVAAPVWLCSLWNEGPLKKNPLPSPYCPATHPSPKTHTTHTLSLPRNLLYFNKATGTNNSTMGAERARLGLGDPDMLHCARDYSGGAGDASTVSAPRKHSKCQDWEGALQFYCKLTLLSTINDILAYKWSYCIWLITVDNNFDTFYTLKTIKPIYLKATAYRLLL